MKSRSAVTLLATLLTTGLHLHAQAPVAGPSPDATAYSTSAASSALPDAPQAQAPAQEHSDQQTTRILGIIPNFRAVSTSEHLPPQSVKEKFVTATEDSFDYSSLALPAVVAAYNYGRNSVPQFGSGGLGYSRYLWHSAVDQTVENYMVEFFVPAAAHEDTRYYTLGHGGFVKRTGYSLSRIVITRADSGKETFNIGEVGGAALGAAISNAYYPAPQRTVGNTFTQMGTSIGIDALAFTVKEFWPDINHALFHGERPHSNTTPTPQAH
jgi:hypothetical protein